jgi:hypothetical protein
MPQETFQAALRDDRHVFTPAYFEAKVEKLRGTLSRTLYGVPLSSEPFDTARAKFPFPFEAAFAFKTVQRTHALARIL